MDNQLDLNKIFEQLDRMPYNEIEGYLVAIGAEAESKGDLDSAISIYNELIGFYRDTTAFDKGVVVKKKLIELITICGYEGTLNQATTLLNVANFDRAAGNYEDSLGEYGLTETIYESLLDKQDYLYASLYNNMSLLFMEMNEYNKSVDSLKKALPIVEAIPERNMEVATTHVNIAQSLVRMNELQDAISHLNIALDIFATTGNTDYHYGAAMAVLGEIRFIEKDYPGSADAYDKAANHVRMIMGQNANVDILIANRDQALKMAGSDEPMMDKKESESEFISGLDLCETYYHDVVSPMIHNLFPEWEDKIAVGLVGEGSDCFGTDDEYSRDHDWGPGVCMWVTDETYACIGPALVEAYNSLDTKYKGYKRNATTDGLGRTGVFVIQDFYDRYASGDESMLATATNGRVFRDDEGIFSSIRNQVLEYYDYDTWKEKLAISLIHMGQTGQYNLPRQLKRGDRVTATIYLGEYIKYTLQTLFIINRVYAPYEKHLLTCAGRLIRHPEVADIMRAITDMDITDDKLIMTIEIVAQIILAAVKEIGLISENEDNYYLEQLGRKMLTEPVTHEELIDRIVKMEWEAFDKVQNEGGRASCQDNWITFEIMRKSQYMEWDDEMITSFIADFEDATARGWNLITEKYGRMEKSTAPERYAEIEALLPPLSESKEAIIEEIVRIQVGMMEEVAERYPKLAMNARSIHTSEDNEHNTSYETYLRGELGTYSDRTLMLYGRKIVNMARAGENIAYKILNNTALLYGYESMEACEAVL